MMMLLLLTCASRDLETLKKMAIGTPYKRVVEEVNRSHSRIS